MSLVIYGPQGCGKSKHKDELAAHFCMSQIIDGWEPGDALPENALALTNAPEVEGAIAFSEALALLTAI